jgi:hypothetical protein
MTREALRISTMDGTRRRAAPKSLYARAGIALAAAGLVDLTGAACTIGPEPGSIAAEGSNYTNFPTQSPTPTHTLTPAETSPETTDSTPASASPEASPSSASPEPTVAPAPTVQPASVPVRSATIEPDQSKLGSDDFSEMYNGYTVIFRNSPTRDAGALNNQSADPTIEPHIRYGDNPASQLTGFCYVDGGAAGSMQANYGQETRWATVDSSEYVASRAVESSEGDVVYVNFAALGDAALGLAKCSPADFDHNPAGY